jgi:hypothetical protein
VLRQCVVSFALSGWEIASSGRPSMIGFSPLLICLMIMISISLFGVLAGAAVTKQKVEKRGLSGGQDMLSRL